MDFELFKSHRISLNTISLKWVSVPKIQKDKIELIKYICSLSSDPSTFIPNIDFIGENTVTMWGPDGWENNLPVFSYLAKYTDSQDVVINVDKRIGGTWEELEDYAWKLADPLGRIPAHSRTGTKRIDVNYGKKSNKFFDIYTKYYDTIQFFNN